MSINIVKKAHGDDSREFEKLISNIKDIELLVLKIHLHIEKSFDLIILYKLEGSNKLVEKAKFSFFQKYLIVEAIGIVEEKAMQSVHQLNKLRNSLSHKIDYEVSIEDITKVGSPLGKSFASYKRKHNNDDRAVLTSILCGIAGEVRGSQLKYTVGSL